MVSLDQTSIFICMSTVNHGLFGSMIFMEDSSLDYDACALSETDKFDRFKTFVYIDITIVLI